VTVLKDCHCSSERFDQRANLGDPSLPDAKRVLVGNRVRAAVGAIPDCSADCSRIELAERLGIRDRRLLARGELDAG